jgi:hypothetical protein
MERGPKAVWKRERQHTVELTSATAARAQQLIQETPSPRIARVAANLDSLTVSTRAVILKLRDHRVLRGHASAVSLDDLKQHLGTDVVVEGELAFRPNGEPLRLAIDFVKAAVPGDAIWAKVARPEARRATRPASSPSNDLERFFGAWPGDETDEELLAVLRDTA